MRALEFFLPLVLRGKVRKGAAFLIVALSSSVIRASNITAIADGQTLDTTAIQKSIDACSASGGGTLHFPPGKYLTGTIQLKSNVTLDLDKNATILGSPDPADYRNLDPFTDGSGHQLGDALIVAVDADHIAIQGLGSIDGQGAKLKAAEQDDFSVRPFLCRFLRSSNIAIRDVKLTNPGAWTLSFFQSKSVLIDGLTIRTRDQRLGNNDGINIDSSRNVQVRDCDIISGDDALVIKSTSPTIPSSHISATNCSLSTRNNAIKLGTESIGGFDDISISNCRITSTNMAGIALYTVDGGDLRNVAISNISMDGVAVPISIRLGACLRTFRAGDQPKPAPGKLENVLIQNVTAKNIGMIGVLINGLPDHPIENLTLRNIDLDLPGDGPEDAVNIELPEEPSAYPEVNMFGDLMPAWAIYARHARNLVLEKVTTTAQTPDPRPRTVYIDVHPPP